MTIVSMEDRLVNWGKVVRDPKWQPKYCASWARTAVAIRNAENPSVEERPAQLDVEDGWLLELAWQNIRDPFSKRLLQHHYVFEYPPNLVCRILVQKYEASPSLFHHWDVRILKVHGVMKKVLDDLGGGGELKKYSNIFDFPLANKEKLIYSHI